MSGMADWRSYKGQQQKRRQARLGPRTEAILHLKVQGYAVEQKSAYHFRINGRIDVWPIHNRWHDLKTQERGGCQNLASWVKARIRPNETGKR